MSAPPIVTFLSDYGADDDFAGVCRGVIARECPQARVIDITHGVPRHAVRLGALVLRNALPYMPVGVHLAVVDPGVGTTRRAVALRTAQEDRLLVGPDNGLLWLAAERFGGVSEAVDVGRSPWRLEPASATFHGRDLFAPVAARLAAGEPLAAAGEPCDASALTALELPSARQDGDGLVAHALAADRFGNLALNAAAEQLAQAGMRLGRALELEAGGRRVPARYALTFADVGEGEALVYEDAYRSLAVAVNRGSAAEVLGVGHRRRAAHRAGVSGLGRPRLHLRVADSTNQRARELAGADAPHGTLVTAREQTAGRGRQGRRWAAPAGRALLMSLVLRTGRGCCRWPPAWPWPRRLGRTRW